MKIFITGSTGYIGHALTKRLVDLGHELKTLCRPNSLNNLRHPQVEAIIGTLDDHHIIAQAMKGCDLVYHLAAFARVWSRDKSVYSKINVDGTRNILGAAAQAGIKKVVFTSTGGVFGPGSLDQPVHEELVRQVPFFNAYESTKHEAEVLCREYASLGLPVVIVNPTRVYGTGIETDSNAISRLIKLIKQGKWRFIPGDGSKVGNYVHVNDVVNGHVLAMEKGRSGERYILGGENWSYNDLIKLIRDQCRPGMKLIKLPLSVMMAFARFEEMKANITRKPPMITDEWVRKYLYDWALTSEKAMRELGYSIIPVKGGIIATIKELK